jgi:hypothetical protein
MWLTPSPQATHRGFADTGFHRAEMLHYVQHDTDLGDDKLSRSRDHGSVLTVQSGGTFGPLHVAAMIVHYA